MDTLEALKTDERSDLIGLTSSIVSSFVGGNSVSAKDLPGIISDVHSALTGLAGGHAVPAETQEPAVPIRLSVKKEYIVCLEDGKKLKMLKRHLMSHYGMTPEDYRAKWNLPNDYPMVAPAYAEQRRVLAKAIGLGRHPDSGRKRKPATATAKKK